MAGIGGRDEELEYINLSEFLSRKRRHSYISPGDGGNRDGKKRSLILLDSDLFDCPICYEALTIPIFQCDNGHLACSSCCPKLSNKCPTCALRIGHNRNRAMESVLESISVPCPNAKFGCTKNVSFGKESSTHEKECNFSPCSCPVQGCNYTSSYKDLYYHCDEHTLRDVRVFRSGISIGAKMLISDKLLIIAELGMKLLFAMQCFREPYGVYVTVSCIAPSTPEVGEFSYYLSYTVDGHTLTYKSPKMKRVLEVSSEIPRKTSMLVPNDFLCGEVLDMKLLIKKLKQE